MSYEPTYVTYQQFTDIPKQTRNTILKKLGVSAGIMRSEAKEHNPICAVAFSGSKPVGWATLGYYTRELSVFVAPGHRNRGIGTHLVKLISESTESEIISFPFNKKGLDFYSRFANIRCDEDNLKWIDEQEVEKQEKKSRKRK